VVVEAAAHVEQFGDGDVVAVDCIWGQRLDPATKRPIGEAFGFEHFHDASQKDLDGLWNGDGADLSVARDKIIVSLVQWHVGIWMTQIQ
jgi:hypothetical protein